jgi:hypothetical protein
VEPAVLESQVSVLGSWMGPGRKWISVEPGSTPFISAEHIAAASFIPASSQGICSFY